MITLEERTSPQITNEGVLLNFAANCFYVAYLTGLAARGGYQFSKFFGGALIKTYQNLGTRTLFIIYDNLSNSEWIGCTLYIS